MYEGDFSENAYNGQGIYYEDFGKYVGEFKVDSKQGHGICHYNNSDHYEGNWEANVRHGHGKLSKVSRRDL